MKAPEQRFYNLQRFGKFLDIKISDLYKKFYGCSVTVQIQTMYLERVDIFEKWQIFVISKIFALNEQHQYNF